MPQRWILVCLVGTLLVPAIGAEPCSRHPWWEIFCPPRLRLSTCCPDDYTAKPVPCTPPPYCPCGCDDYCSKPFPCLPPEYHPCGCDDYCSKQIPPVPCCDLPGAKCCPTDGGCARPWSASFSWPWWRKGLCQP